MFQATPSTLALATAAVVSVPLTYVLLDRSSGRGTRPVVALLASAAVWAGVVLAVEVASTGAVAASLHRLTYTVGGIAVATWFMFVLEYTGRGRLLSTGTVAALSVEPAVVTALAWTGSSFVPVFGAGTGIDPATGRFVLDRALGFWIHEAYAFSLLLAGAVLLGLNVHRSKDLTGEQVGALAAGVLVPLATALPYALGLTRVDLAPVGLVAAAGAFGYAVFRYDLVEVAPVAHDTIVENIRDGVFVLDRRDRVVEINPTGRHILGIDDGDAVGRHASEVLSVYPGLYERYEDVAEVQEEIGLDDGDRRRFFHIQVSPLFDRGDRRVGRLFLVHEITDQKRRQRELARQNRRLDQFASLLSHDLRNPLNVADGFVELARKTGDTDNLDRVADSLDRMDSLIDDVLTLARQGQTIAETESVDLAEVAREAWGNVDTADATLTVGADLAVEADPDRLVRLFENLFRTAVEHARPDVVVRVGAADAGDGVDRAGFYVSDDGPGVPEAHRDDVLEDGFSTSEDGLGLGLSIVRSIVEAHGWGVSVGESDAGGARFEVTGVDLARDRDQRPARADGGA
jgi:PAS domain S-box-containing protein